MSTRSRLCRRPHKKDHAGIFLRRNRYYDPVTGKFTQEDPIGLAGGLNVYGFAAGDPVSYGDPYGLIVCAASLTQRRQIEDAFEVDIAWDAGGCVTTRSQIEGRPGSSAFTSFQDDLRTVAEAPQKFTVRGPGWGPRTAGGSNIHRTWFFWGKWYRIVIDPEEPKGYYHRDPSGPCSWVSPYPMSSMVIHEFGNALSVVQGRGFDHDAAAAYENRYNTLRGQLTRDDSCDLSPG